MICYRLSNSLPAPSQPVMSKQHNVQQATTTVHMPFFAHGTFLQDSMSEFEHPPAYPSGTSDISCSSSPSQLSDPRFPSTPVDAYQYQSFHSTSPSGRSHDLDMGYTRSYPEDRIRIPSTPSIPTNDTEGSIEVGKFTMFCLSVFLFKIKIELVLSLLHPPLFSVCWP